MKWRSINPSVGTVMMGLDAIMRKVPDHLLCRPEDAERVYVFSDYSGDYAASSYFTYTFLIADLSASHKSLKAFRDVRDSYHLGTRRMSYKSLRDAYRKRAFPDFVRAALGITGQVITFAISKEIKTVFSPPDDDDADPDLLRIAQKYKSPSGREHLARVIHFFSFAIAGLTQAGQNVDWITDVDQIAPTQDWLADLAELAGNISSHYLQHTLGHLRVGTTRSDDGTLLIEDLCAVADLFAGAVAETLSHQVVPALEVPSGLVLPVARSVRRKAVDVMLLLRNDRVEPLRSTCICFEPEGSGLRLQIRYFHEMPVI